MKTSMVLFAAVLMLSWAAIAQDAPGTASATLTGCLAGSAGSYTLTDHKGMSYALTGKTGDLAPHVGHQIEVTGQGAPNSTASETSSGNATEASFQVASSKMISDQCPTGAMGTTAGSGKSVAVGTWDKGTTNTPATEPSVAAAATADTAAMGTVNQTPATAEAATSTNTMSQAETASASSASATPAVPAEEPAAAAPPIPDPSASAAQSAEAANPPAEAPAPPDQPTLTASKTDAELPQTASSLPLFGILAIGFLCAGYMTLKTS